MKKNVKLIGKFLGKIVGSVGCLAILGVSVYFLCMGLNWGTGKVVEALSKAADYLMSDWVAVAVVVVFLTLGAMIFDGIWARIKNRKANKTNEQSE